MYVLCQCIVVVEKKKRGKLACGVERVIFNLQAFIYGPFSAKCFLDQCMRSTYAALSEQMSNLAQCR